MIIVEQWILESRDVRTKHIVETEPCLERGGNSTVHRGILAQYLNTNLPDKIDLCHHCGNGECSNPKHLYWGTRKENIEDARKHGTFKTGWDRLVEKLGIDGAKQHLKNISNPSNAGKAHKGKPKSLEHRKRISEGLRNKNSKPL